MKSKFIFLLRTSLYIKPLLNIISTDRWESFKSQNQNAQIRSFQRRFAFSPSLFPRQEPLTTFTYELLAPFHLFHCQARPFKHWERGSLPDQLELSNWVRLTFSHPNCLISDTTYLSCLSLLGQFFAQCHSLKTQKHPDRYNNSKEGTLTDHRNKHEIANHVLGRMKTFTST